MRWPGRKHAWLVYLTLTAALGLAYLVPASPLNAGPVFNVLGLSSVFALVIGARMHRIAQPAWLMIAVGQAAFVAGDVLAYNYERFFGSALPFPSVADLFYLATYPFVIAGLLLLVRQRTPSHDRASLIDTLIAAVGAGVLSWTVLIAPYAHDPSLTLFTKLTSIAYPVMDLAVFACVIRFGFGRGRRPVSFFLLMAATASLLVTDAIYGWLLLHGGYETGGMLDAGWIAFYLLCGVAALHPKMPDLVAAAPDTQYRLTNRRLATFAACSVAAPVILVVQALRGGASDVPLLAACSAAGFLLVVLRLRDLVDRHQRVLARATVLAEVGVRLIEARTRSGVKDAASDAAQEIIGRPCRVDLSEGDVEPPVAVSPTTLVLPLRGRATSRGHLSVETAAVIDADTAEALRALANEVALALDGIALADDLLRKRTEARFQSLVQNSSDVIIVVDATGKVDFASPAALRVFGYAPTDLQGRQFVELIADGDRTRVAHAVLGEVTSALTQSLEFELETRHGPLAVEAMCTNLSADENVAGVVLNIRDITERKEFERQLAHQAFHDETTGLANRALFRDRVEHALARAQRASCDIPVLFIDVDDFKTVNDTLGHAAGDNLLRSIGARIAAVIRAGDTAARLGGDEFAVLLEENGSGEAANVAERIIRAISEPLTLDGHELLVTASVGIAESGPGDDISADTLLRNADVAMYSAKEAGKGLYRHFEPDMHAVVVERLELKRALQVALDRQEFELHFQPIVDLVSGRIVSLEALLRWRHPDRGLIPPDRFIPLAEETGVIVPIGGWVLEEACKISARLLEAAGADAPSLSVNLSGRQLQRPELVAEIDATLARTGLPAGQLVLEITETAMMADLDLALMRLDELKSRGIRIAIDDFGSGYSSLNYIRRFPVDILKIDRSFIADVHKPGELASLTRAIVELSEILNIIPVAEGIEEQAQLSELRDMGCRLGQGFLFMRPVVAGEVEGLLRRRLTVA